MTTEITTRIGPTKELSQKKSIATSADQRRATQQDSAPTSPKAKSSRRRSNPRRRDLRNLSTTPEGSLPPHPTHIYTPTNYGLPLLQHLQHYQSFATYKPNLPPLQHLRHFQQLPQCPSIHSYPPTNPTTAA
jgi:hypothetical protein